MNALETACGIYCVPVPKIIKQDRFRITISEPDPEWYKYALKIEACMQDLTKRPIELLFEPLADKNKRAGRNGRE